MSRRQDRLAIEILQTSLMYPGKVKSEMVEKAENHLISVFPMTYLYEECDDEDEESRPKRRI